MRRKGWMSRPREQARARKRWIREGRYMAKVHYTPIEKARGE